MRNPVRQVTLVVLTASILALASGSRAEDKSPATFRQKCAACHGPDGKAQTPAAKNLGVKSFADATVAKMSDADLSTAIEKGKGKMPSYGKVMSADDVKAMVAYIRTLAK
ncbi:MAG TPA: cytochrome c [Candidatus Acidoferrum sp.]|nr:cytochrome c [Candidatus Acidoferrum sp.]